MARSHGKNKRWLALVLSLLVILLLAAVIATMTLFFLEREKHKLPRDFSEEVVVDYDQTVGKQGEKPTSCMTQGCVEAAAQIERSIDFSVSPCDDLYQYACGRWQKEKDIPEGKEKLTLPIILQANVDTALQQLLGDDFDLGDLEYVNKVKIFYASCTNIELINKRGDQPLKDALSEMGGWPLTTQGWVETNFDMVDLQLKLNKKYNERPVFYFKVSESDPNDTRKPLLSMEGPMVDKKTHSLYTGERNSTGLKSYEKFIYNIAEAVGFYDGHELATAQKEIEEMVDFQVALAKISDPEAVLGLTKEYMTLAEIQEKHSKHFDWTKYVKELLATKEIGITDVKEDQPILVVDPKYYEQLDELLDNTPKRTVFNYMYWVFVYQMVTALGDTYMDMLNEYLQVEGNAGARYVMCNQQAVQYLGMAVSKMYSNGYFNSYVQHAVRGMVKEIVDSANQLLNDVQWMDEETKSEAQERISNLKVDIGHSDKVGDDLYLEEYYGNLYFNAEEYFENIVKVKTHNFYTTVSKMARDDKPATSVTVSYDHVKNLLMVPAGFLQPPAFHMAFPMSVLYGAIGPLIGQMITHVFDDKGRYYFDEAGTRKDWYGENTNCFVDQYGNFNLTINGTQSLRNTFAENSGLHLGIKAFRNWMAEQGKKELPLPGVDFTHDQLFFLSFAQGHCTLMRSNELLDKILDEGDVPGRYKVMGVVQNSREFSEAFKCSPGSPMNPEEKCEVW